jgi:hypothetical protein
MADHIEHERDGHRLEEMLSESSRQRLLDFAFRLRQEKRERQIEAAYQDRERLSEAS